MAKPSFQKHRDSEIRATTSNLDLAEPNLESFDNCSFTMTFTGVPDSFEVGVFKELKADQTTACIASGDNRPRIGVIEWFKIKRTLGMVALTIVTQDGQKHKLNSQNGYLTVGF